MSRKNSKFFQNFNNQKHVQWKVQKAYFFCEADQGLPMFLIKAVCGKNKWGAQEKKSHPASETSDYDQHSDLVLYLVASWLLLYWVLKLDRSSHGILPMYSTVWKGFGPSRTFGFFSSPSGSWRAYGSSNTRNASHLRLKGATFPWFIMFLTTPILT